MGIVAVKPLVLEPTFRVGCIVAPTQTTNMIRHGVQIVVSFLGYYARDKGTEIPIIKREFNRSLVFGGQLTIVIARKAFQMDNQYGW